MQTLKFKVEGQNITKSADTDWGSLARGAAGYTLAEFALGEEWNKCKKAAIFQVHGEEIPRKITRGRCAIPDKAANAKHYYIRLVGKCGEYQITTGKVEVRQK